MSTASEAREFLLPSLLAMDVYHRDVEGGLRVATPNPGGTTVATQVLLNFRKVIKDAADVRIHPVVARQIDPEVLKKLGAEPSGAAQGGKG